MSPRVCVLAASAALLGGCGGSNPNLLAPPPPTPPVAFTSHASAHFTFRYTAMDAASVAATGAAVEAHHARILGDLGLEQIPSVTVTLYPDPDSFRAAVAPLVGNVPSFASGLVSGPRDIHVLSPNLSSRWSYAEGVTAIVHEFAHCASMRVNPAIANNPRWLWEAVALYEAGQILDPRTLPYMTAHRPPALSDLNRIDNTAIYEVGGLIGEFIVETRGRGALRDLVRTGGALPAVMGVDEAGFVSRWFEYEQHRYGLD